MVILAMDTSTDQLSLALGKDDGALIASWTSAVPKMHATLFHPVLDQMLAAVHINLQDLGAIVVGVGPGSYTGVRIAVTAAKVFAYTLNIPVVTVSSLEAAAYSARAHHGLVVVAWDARRRAAYSAAFRSDPLRDSWECVLPDARREFSQLASELLETTKMDEKVLLLGNASSSMADLIFEKGHGVNLGVYEKRTLLSGEFILEIGRKKLLNQTEMAESSSALESAHGLVPNYLQLAEAQARLLPDTRGE